MITSDSVQKYDVKIEADGNDIAAVGRVEFAEANEDACAAVIIEFAAVAKVIVFNRTELIQKMYEVLAKAARVSIDGVGDIENDIDAVRDGAPLVDYTFYFEL